MVRTSLKMARLSFYIPLVLAVAAVVTIFVLLGSGRFITLLNNAMAGVPGLKNFATVNYETQLFVTGVESRRDLKTGFLAVDYLASIKDADGGVFLTVYPFEIEAGYDLGQVRYKEHEAGTPNAWLEVTLPAPALNVSGGMPLTIRDNMEGKSEYVTAPLKRTFQDQAKVYALAHGDIYGQAEDNARRFLTGLFQELYRDVRMTVDKVTIAPVTVHSSQRIPLAYQLPADFPFQWQPEADFAPWDGRFVGRNSSDILTGVSREFIGDVDQLRVLVMASYPERKVIKFIDPIEPENIMVCANSEIASTCFRQHQGQLYFNQQDYADREVAKNHLHENMTLAFSSRPVDEPSDFDRYLNYSKALREGRAALAKKKYGEVQRAALRMEETAPGNPYVKVMQAVAAMRNDGAVATASGIDDLDLAVQLYRAIDTDNYAWLDADKRRALKKEMSPDSALYGRLRLYLLEKNEFLNLPESDLASLMQGVAEGGPISTGLLAKLPDEVVADIFRYRLTQISAKEGDASNRLYCGEDAKGQPSYGESCRNRQLFYDQSALEKYYRAGRDTVPNTLTNELKVDLKKCMAVLVGRATYKSLLWQDYDLFLVGKDGIEIVKEFEDDREKDYLEYGKFNLGHNPQNGEITIGDLVYGNQALFEFLDFIHGAQEDNREELRGLIEADVFRRVSDVMRVPEV